MYLSFFFSCIFFCDTRRLRNDTLYVYKKKIGMTCVYIFPLIFLLLPDLDRRAEFLSVSVT